MSHQFQKAPIAPYERGVSGYSNGTNKVLGTTKVLHTFLPSEVRAYAAERGRKGRLSNSEFVAWSLRMEIEAGHYDRVSVLARRLPPETHQTVVDVFAGFLDLLGCRWLHTPGAPAPFAPEFAAAWVGGITPRQASTARMILVRLGAMVEAGKVNRIKLWLPSGISEGGRP
jgi:hypothetical protein